MGKAEAAGGSGPAWPPGFCADVENIPENGKFGRRKTGRLGSRTAPKRTKPWLKLESRQRKAACELPVGRLQTLTSLFSVSTSHGLPLPCDPAVRLCVV